MAKTAWERFWAKVRPSPDGCMLWTGYLSKGYGRFTENKRSTSPQRWLYEQTRGPVPKGMHLDHTCHTAECDEPEPCHHRSCVIHVAPATPKANILRGKGRAAANALKTHCRRGHEFTPENTHVAVGGGRTCRECQRMHTGRYRETHPYAAHPKAPRSHCPSGHAMSGDNLILWGPRRAWRKCKECGRTAARNHARRRREAAPS